VGRAGLLQTRHRSFDGIVDEVADGLCEPLGCVTHSPAASCSHFSTLRSASTTAGGIAFLLLCLNLGDARLQSTPLGFARESGKLPQMCELLPDLLGRQDAPDGGPRRVRVALA
jgi:hypothetical protein